jgi:hypothetical protein
MAHDTEGWTLQPPEIKDGYLSKEAIDDFLSQIYEEPRVLQSHTGRLHAIILNGVWFQTLKLKVRCQDCHGNLQAKSCRSRASNHASGEERRKMEISFSSIRELTLQEFKAGTSRVGPVALKDFELLYSSL